ncbi:HutD family protein [Arthrobacter sp. NicSoilB8]|uniref:HutD/Ves family protein n=1 Tax=Arthrobacter sp. NicSoilB8 TaxID=2830998 RepID=UPI001E7A8199|nr:HutD family protein [Arthrobacter sp. NicSoilB8]BCW69061.1 hypothetical protein NicSoilB8_01050 [Arthrobacter sp. NicSoilB8]
MPWKNGAGTTREIAVFPAPGENTEIRSTGFWWRISVADIVQDAAFSTFDDADRQFLVATPSALILDVAGAERAVCQGRPVAFSGEDEVAVKVVTGPTSVINLITRRSACSGAIDVQLQDGRVAISSTAVAVVLLAGSARTGEGRKLVPMQFLLPGPEPETLDCESAIVAVIHVHAATEAG